MNKKNDKKKSGWKEKETGKVEVPTQIKKLYSKYGTKYQAGLRIILDKETAQMLFDNGDPNRDLKEHCIAAYLKAMNSGEWEAESAENICMSPEMRMNDGQNRIVAFIRSDLETLYFDFAINIKKNTIIYIKDGGKKRSPTDRLTMLCRHNENRDPHKIEMSLMTQAMVYSNANNLMTVDARLMGSILYDDYGIETGMREALKGTLDMYDKLNISVTIKRCDVYWGNIIRGYLYFKQENRLDELFKFSVMVFNSRAGVDTDYDGWAKLASDCIVKNKLNKAKGTMAVRKAFSSTINTYLHNYFIKVPCPPEQRAKMFSKPRDENFPFADEMGQEVVSDEMGQEVVSVKSIIKHKNRTSETV